QGTKPSPRRQRFRHGVLRGQRLATARVLRRPAYRSSWPVTWRRWADARPAVRSAQSYPVYDDVEVEGLQPPAWLVDGIMPRGGLAVLYGPPGIGKSFLAQDWALSVGAGLEWLGRSIHMGPVVYVAAEGTAGLPNRVRAWKLARGFVGRADVHFVT